MIAFVNLAKPGRVLFWRHLDHLAGASKGCDARIIYAVDARRSIVRHF